MNEYTCAEPRCGAVGVKGQWLCQSCRAPLRWLALATGLLWSKWNKLQRCAEGEKNLTYLEIEALGMEIRATQGEIARYVLGDEWDYQLAVLLNKAILAC